MYTRRGRRDIQISQCCERKKNHFLSPALLPAGHRTQCFQTRRRNKLQTSIHVTIVHGCHKCFPEVGERESFSAACKCEAHFRPPLALSPRHTRTTQFTRNWEVYKSHQTESGKLKKRKRKTEKAESHASSKDGTLQIFRLVENLNTGWAYQSVPIGKQEASQSSKWCKKGFLTRRTHKASNRCWWSERVIKAGKGFRGEPGSLQGEVNCAYCMVIISRCHP